MIFVKKLIFAPFFLIIFTILTYQLNPLFDSYETILSLSWTTLIQLTTLTALILITSLLFNLFATFAQDWKLSLPVGLIASLIPLPLINPPLGLILVAGNLVSMLLGYLSLENRLKTYLTFEPNSLLGPSIRHLAGLLVLTISLTYFLSINKIIQQEGFQIPDSLIETSLKLAAPAQTETDQPEQSIQPAISQEQIELLKKNPDLLRQYGIDPKILDSLTQPSKGGQSVKPPSDLAQDTLKQAVKDQLETLIRPYLGIVPAILAISLFLILQSIVSILNLLIYPLLWIIFYIMEKTGFVQFTTEMRPVKKMVF